MLSRLHREALASLIVNALFLLVAGCAVAILRHTDIHGMESFCGQAGLTISQVPPQHPPPPPPPPSSNAPAAAPLSEAPTPAMGSRPPSTYPTPSPTSSSLTTAYVGLCAIEIIGFYPVYAAYFAFWVLWAYHFVTNRIRLYVSKYFTRSRKSVETKCSPSSPFLKRDSFSFVVKASRTSAILFIFGAIITADLGLFISQADKIGSSQPEVLTYMHLVRFIMWSLVMVICIQEWILHLRATPIFVNIFAILYGLSLSVLLVLNARNASRIAPNSAGEFVQLIHFCFAWCAMIGIVATNRMLPAFDAIKTPEEQHAQSLLSATVKAEIDQYCTTRSSIVNDNQRPSFPAPRPSFIDNQVGQFNSQFQVATNALHTKPPADSGETCESSASTNVTIDGGGIMMQSLTPPEPMFPTSTESGGKDSSEISGSNSATDVIDKLDEVQFEMRKAQCTIIMKKFFLQSRVLWPVIASALLCGSAGVMSVYAYDYMGNFVTGSTNADDYVIFITYMLYSYVAYGLGEYVVLVGGNYVVMETRQELNNRFGWVLEQEIASREKPGVDSSKPTSSIDALDPSSQLLMTETSVLFGTELLSSLCLYMFPVSEAVASIAVIISISSTLAGIMVALLFGLAAWQMFRGMYLSKTLDVEKQLADSKILALATSFGAEYDTAVVERRLLEMKFQKYVLFFTTMEYLITVASMTVAFYYGNQLYSNGGISLNDLSSIVFVSYVLVSSVAEITSQFHVIATWFQLALVPITEALFLEPNVVSVIESY